MESRGELADSLPRLYREALDAVDQLSELGLRRDASKLRDRAIASYSRAWDERCRATLEEVRRDARAAIFASPARLGRPLPGAGLPS